MIPVSPTNGTLGGLIRRYRQLGGLTQEELGEKAGLSVRGVRNLEQDRVRQPRRSTLKRLASALGASELDPTRLVPGGQVVELTGASVTTAESCPVPRDAWLHRQPILAHVAERFQLGQVLVIQIRLACPACTAPPDVGHVRGSGASNNVDRAV